MSLASHARFPLYMIVSTQFLLLSPPLSPCSTLPFPKWQEHNKLVGPWATHGILIPCTWKLPGSGFALAKTAFTVSGLLLLYLHRNTNH